MENFINEIINVVKLPFNEITKDFKVIMISDKIIYVTNYLKILDYSTSRLALKVPNNIITFEGENLIISQINKNEIIIKGKIKNYFLGVKNDEK